SLHASTVVTIEQTCAVRWKSFGNSCYLFVRQERKNWEDARSHCLMKGADLVSLTTEAEIRFLYDHTWYINKDIWIGLNKINRTKLSSDRAWVWSNGDKRTIVKWSKKEPNDLKDQHCVEIEEGSMFWRNQECDKKRAWICEKSKRINNPFPSLQKLKALLQFETTKENTTKALRITSSTKKYTNIQESFMSSTQKVFPKIVPTKESTTKGQTTFENPSVFSVRTALYIFLPIVLLALIIVIIVIVRTKRLRSSKRKASKQDHRDDGQKISKKDLGGQTDSNPTIIDDAGYAQLHHNREPENAYASLNLYETPDVDYDGPYVISNDSHNNHINEPNISAPLRNQRSSYVIPSADYG
ncbi:uncharacterized protein LOC114544771, partial [Dendronephthya gigantea]|uniref:uncharacterized protein LOC114544771 n=1 Tax=Dendronephthya gigantea TaxID=151771 RepID=UPI00106D3C55